MPAPRYHFKVYSRTGVFIADLTGLATSRKFTVGRNEPDQITFDLDSDELKRYADSLGTTPEGILLAGSNELRVYRRNDAGSDIALVGGRIDLVTDSAESERSKSVTVRGFLTMFNDRLFEVERVFTSEDAGVIAWTLIDESQTGSSNIYTTPLPDPDNCDFGITEGTVEALGNHDRTYEVGKPIAEALKQLTEVGSFTMDFWFTPEKEFNVAARQGSDKPLVKFGYPHNVTSLDIPNDASAMANRVLTLGTDDGAGSRLQSVDEDEASQLNYQVRQRREQYNAIEVEATLSEHGQAAVALRKNPIRVPSLTADLTSGITIEDFWVGDRITVENEHPSLPQLSGLYRVERINMTIEDNGKESADIEVSL